MNPKLQALKTYISRKIESEFYNLIQNSLVEREIEFENSLTTQDQFFDKN